MPNKNQITLIGHLGKDAELKVNKNEKEYVKFSIATKDGRGDFEKTNWHNITVMGFGVGQAKHFLKGDAVEVSGSLEYYEKTVKDDTGSDFTLMMPSIKSFEAYKIDYVKKDTKGVDYNKVPDKAPTQEAEEDALPF